VINSIGREEECPAQRGTLRPPWKFARHYPRVYASQWLYRFNRGPARQIAARRGAITRDTVTPSCSPFAFPISPGQGKKRAERSELRSTSFAYRRCKPSLVYPARVRARACTNTGGMNTREIAAISNNIALSSSRRRRRHRRGGTASAKSRSERRELISPLHTWEGRFAPGEGNPISRSRRTRKIFSPVGMHLARESRFMCNRTRACSCPRTSRMRLIVRRWSMSRRRELSLSLRLRIFVSPTSIFLLETRHQQLRTHFMDSWISTSAVQFQDREWVTRRCSSLKKGNGDLSGFLYCYILHEIASFLVMCYKGFCSDNRDMPLSMIRY